MSNLISIVVPIYNAENYLKECIDSIISQGFSNIEVILVDDGSTDHSGMICDTYAQQDSRVRVFHLKNGGVSAARNFGIEQSTGDYIMFVDSDDALAWNALEKIQATLAYNADVVIFGNRIIRDGVSSDHIPNSGLLNREEFGGRYIELYTQFFINSPWNKVYKRKKIDDTMIFPETMSLGEDMVFCNSYLRQCHSFLILSEPLYIYKIRSEDSLSTKYHDGLFDIYCDHYWDVVRTMNCFDAKWEREECTELYRMYYRYVKQSINMTWHERNKATMMDRYQEIKRICRHEFTRECVAHTECKSVYDILLRHRFAAGLFLYLAGAKMKAEVRKL